MLGRLLCAAIILSLLVLDWAALHDILRNEPNQAMEWIMLALSAPCLFFTVRLLLRG